MYCNDAESSITTKSWECSKYCMIYIFTIIYIFIPLVDDVFTFFRTKYYQLDQRPRSLEGNRSTDLGKKDLDSSKAHALTVI